MSKSHYFYTKLKVIELEKLISDFQEKFDTELKDLFSDEELLLHEKKIDSIAAIYAQPIISELSFDDFYFAEDEEAVQRSFFESSRSSISVENIPYLQDNPFQVSYLLDLLSLFDDVLIDTGGVNELSFKTPYVDNLKKYRTMHSLLGLKDQIPKTVKPFVPVHQIDFFVIDVYKEIDRLRFEGKLDSLIIESEKRMKILSIMKEEKLGTEDLLHKSGLGAKAFDDNMEGLKFFLKKQ